MERAGDRNKKPGAEKDIKQFLNPHIGNLKQLTNNKLQVSENRSSVVLELINLGLSSVKALW